jgi:7,8-dihydropterin-6-yl-methyl-4-(beta-D-ribofuranosyl)aminobenzene 5'-phosphate synthase
MSVEITVLIENLASPADPILLNEHGLALWIKTGEKNILFDTGKTGKFVLNAARLDVNLADADAVVLSHAHYDHSGGLLALLEYNQTAPLYIGQNAGDAYYARGWFSRRFVGLDPAIFERFAERLKTVDNSAKIVDNVYIKSGIEHNYPTPRGNQLLFKLTDGKLVHDRFEHELMMIIQNQEGLVIITGCSHSGVLNMVDTAQTLFPGQPVQALIGGFHFIGSTLPGRLAQTDREIDAIARQLMKMNVRQVYTCHCTSDRGYQRLKQTLGSRIEYLNTGTRLKLG